MTIMVGLNMVIAALLGFTGALSIGASLGMRGNRPMALFGVALLLGSLQTVIMTTTGDRVQTLAAAILAPAAYMIVGIAITLMPVPARAETRLVPAVVVLAAAAAALVLFDAPYIVQMLTVQLACALPVLFAVRQMMVRARPSLLDGTILAGLSFVAACSLARIPLLLFYFGPEVTPVQFRTSVFETILLSVSGLMVPPLIFLLIARNVGDRLAAYQQQSERDGLTGLLNRRGLDALAQMPVEDGGAVVFCDIDHFKSVNDRFGHQAGDDVIRTFATILSRAGYPAGRMGGEEFSVIVPGQSRDAAVDLAEMFRSRMNETSHFEQAANVRVSASFGVATFAPGMAPHTAFALADRALYKAKRDGRDRVVSEPVPIDGAASASRRVA